MNRTRNTVRNITWGFFQRIVMIFLPFTTRTLLIKTLGADYLGLSSLFTSVLSLLSLAELGISNAIVSSMYKPIAENDTDTICALMAFYKKAYRIIGSVILSAGIVVMPFLDKLITGDSPADINLYVLYLIYLLDTSLSYFLFAYKNCLFAAHQRNDQTTKIQIVGTTLQYALQIIVLLTLKNYYCYVIVVPFLSVVKNLFTAYLANKAFPNYVCKGSISAAATAELKKRVSGLMIGKISSTVRSSIDSIFISMFLGLTAVAIYSNYLHIVTSVAGVIQLLESSMIAGVGNSIATETLEKNHNDFKKFTFMLQWIVGFCSICILCLIQPFMKIWVGTEYMFRDSITVICAIYLFTNCICLIRSVYTQALGMWWQMRHLSVIDIFVNSILNYVLVKYFGAYGILSATIIDIAFVSIPWTTYFLFRDYFGIQYYKSYMFSYLKYFVVAAFAGGITYWVCGLLNVSNDYLSLLIKASICVLVPNCIYILVFRNSKLFKESKQFVTKKMNK